MKTGWYYWVDGLDYGGIKHFKNGSSEFGWNLDWMGPFRTFEDCKKDALDRFDWDRRRAEEAIKQVTKTKKPRTGK